MTSFDTVRFNIGKKEKVQTKQLLFFIMDYAKIKKHVIGHIKITPKFTDVEINANFTNQVIENCNNQRLNRHKIRVQKLD